MTQPTILDRNAINAPRRRDRTVEDEAWIRQFLTTAPVGTLATVDDDQPFINSNLFVYDDAQDCIYMHTAKHGRTKTNLETTDTAKVCFSIMEMGRLISAPTAFNFSVEYAGVVVFGLGSVVDGDEALHALNQLMLKYAKHLEFGVDYGAPTVDELKRTSVYRIDITAWSGKKKEVPSDLPEAYWYNGEAILPSNR